MLSITTHRVMSITSDESYTLAELIKVSPTNNDASYFLENGKNNLADVPKLLDFVADYIRRSPKGSIKIVGNGIQDILDTIKDKDRIYFVKGVCISYKDGKLSLDPGLLGIEWVTQVGNNTVTIYGSVSIHEMDEFKELLKLVHTISINTPISLIRQIDTLPSGLDSIGGIGDEYSLDVLISGLTTSNGFIGCSILSDDKIVKKDVEMMRNGLCLPKFMKKLKLKCEESVMMTYEYMIFFIALLESDIILEGTLENSPYSEHLRNYPNYKIL